MVRAAHPLALEEDLAEVLQHARVSASVLDDPQNIENAAVYAWLERRRLGRFGGRNHAIGSDLLPMAWRERTMRFSSMSAAQQFVRHFQGSAASVSAMRSVIQQAERVCLVPMKAADTTQRLAQLLVSGRVWAVELHKLNRQIGKAAPSVYSALNAKFGCNVDFAYLSRWEGGQYLRGYVPFLKDGKVAGASGMTIATGFDIGQRSADAFDALFQGSAVSADELAAMRPFAGHRFKGMTKAQVAQWVAATAPVPNLSVAAANEVDRIVHGEHLEAAIKNWNAARKPNVPAFRDLPAAWQTVVFSRHFHQGVGMPLTQVAKPFWKAAVAGKWDDAVQALRGYGVSQDWYKSRVGQEAALLATALPPPVKDAAPAAKTAAPTGAPAGPAGMAKPPPKLP
jgi:Bacterial toxin homologue of phage lysozyme, C-term